MIGVERGGLGPILLKNGGQRYAFIRILNSSDK